MITPVFDTSAILAHYFHEPGAEQVNALLADNAVEVGVPAIALIELKTRLASSVHDPAEASRAFHLYAEELISAIPVTREIVGRAEEIIQQAGNTLTLLEAIAAATAQSERAVLVHRDANFARLPAGLLEQCALPLDN
jgi:predicted nucleic acid-binding protein